MILPISNVITISVSTAQLALQEYNTGNVALFTHDSPASSFGSAGYALYKDPISVATDFGTSSTTAQMATSLFSQQPNILLPGGYLAAITFGSAETLSAAITRTQGLVSYFGIITDHTLETIGSTDVLATGAIVQDINAIALLVGSTTASISGIITELTESDLTQTRGLYYGGSTAAVLMAAAYAGRGFSTEFDGSLTTQTMHLKPLTTILPDTSMTQTILNNAIAAGADTYPSISGIPSVFCSGANDYFDNVDNLQWFVGALQAAGFNYLAGTGTKIPQTEQGMNGLKQAYRAICQQAIANGYLAPGSWTSPTTFGNQADFFSNIASFGYYIYSEPVSQQNATDRAARKAPLVQIAIKLAGAIQSSSVVVYVND